MASDCQAISVVICTHNRCDLLRGALRSLLTQKGIGNGLEILVVANACTDQTASIIERFGESLPEGVTLRSVDETRLGLSRARNLGLQEASYELIAFMDDDAEAMPGWLAGIREAFQLSPSIAVVGGPVHPVWPYGCPPDWLVPPLQGYFSIVDLGPEPRCLILPHDWLAGANIVFRRSLLLAVGGFSTRLGRSGSFLLSNEESDAMARMMGTGAEAWYSPAMRVRHLIHPERLSRRWLLRRAFWQGVSDGIANQVDDSWEVPRLSDRVLNRLLLIRLAHGLLREFFAFDLLGCRSHSAELAAQARDLGRRFARQAPFASLP